MKEYEYSFKAAAGDSSVPWFWWVLSGISVMGIVTLAILGKRKKEDMQ